MTKPVAAASRPRRMRVGRMLWQNKTLILMCLPAIVFFFIFSYMPMPGMYIAFVKYNYQKGIFGSPFVGLKNFKFLFTSGQLLLLLRNTVLYNLAFIIVGNVLQLSFAILLNEVQSRIFKKTTQSLMFLPYFISAAVMVSIMYTLLSPTSGLVNIIITKLGGTSTNFMAKPEWFRPLYVILEIWQTFGYSAIIYIAAMMNIDPTLYEAAEIDGATRWTKMWRITLPCISTSVITMLIISVGNIFSVNLDRILLMYNTGTYATADVIQTYVYRIAFQSTGFPDYSYGTAVNVLKSVIAFVLVFIVNKIADKVSDARLF